jgi:hypothetical protein
VRVVEAGQPPIAGIVHGQRVFDSMRTLRTGNDAPDHKLHPISGSLIDDVDVSVKIKQVLECMVLLGPPPSHNSILSEGDN